MKMRRLIALFAVTLCSITFACAAQAAHAQLVKSMPADGSVSDTPPSAFVFEFSEAVRFHEVYIKKDDGKSQAIGKLPSSDAMTLTIPAPSLTAGHYVLEWAVFTHQSIVLRGRIQFTVSAGSATESSPPR
jgi:methionine-rich copper-binding protein CopC